MKRRILKYAALGCAVLLIAGIAAPFVRADRYTERIRSALENALHRPVEIRGRTYFTLLTGPGFAVENVVIHDDPAIGVEPIARVGTLTAHVSLFSLWTGGLEFSSVRLDDTSVNLAKTGPAEEEGHWNFEALLNQSFIRTFPEIHIRSGRVNFRFGETKSVFYFLNTDVDIAPPSRNGSDWQVRFAGEPARTDRSAHGFGTLLARGRWIQTGGGKLDLNLEIDRNVVGEMVALVYGHHPGIHGEVSVRLHLAGPLDRIAINGSMRVSDIHRWDMTPPKGEGWLFMAQGRLNLPGQIAELEMRAKDAPVAVRFRASQYLTQPRWGVGANWNGFPIEPILEVARHMGIAVPERLKLAGTFDGAVGYSGGGTMQGELAFHDASLTIPDSPALRFEEARLLFGDGHVHLKPALVRTAGGDEARIEADHVLSGGSTRISISTDGMDVGALRSQVALAAVPWLEQVRSGKWNGVLTWDTADGWSGRITMTDADIPVPGLAEPVRLESANAQIQGARVSLDRIRARLGKLQAQGDYRYEPGALRPHRVRVAMDRADAAEIERILRPSLSRNRGLIARALGRVPVPEWLEHRRLEGTVQIGVLSLAGITVEKVRSRVIWDVTRVELPDLHARVSDALLEGKLSANLRGALPAYHLEGKMSGWEWNGGKVDAEVAADTSGIGADLVSRLRSAGTFSAKTIEIGASTCKTVSGAYQVRWAGGPRLALTDLKVSLAGETYTGQGGTQDDGKLVVQLNGPRELRVSGSLAQLRMDEPPIQ